MAIQNAIFFKNPYLSIWSALVFFCGIYLLYSLGAALNSPLRKIPGPFLARFTRLWYLGRVRYGQFHNENVDLHKKYGSVVRLGPNQYSIDDPQAIRPIYGHGTRFTKSDWYKPAGNPNPSYKDLFTVQDISYHSSMRRKVANLYSNSSVLKLESLVDECVSLLGDRLEQVASRGQPIDLQLWTQCYAFDVIGYVTYGRRFGFLDGCKDVYGMFASLHSYLGYMATVGVIPEVHRLLFPIFLSMGSSGMSHMMTFAREQVSVTRANTSGDAKLTGDDFLSRMISMQKEDVGKLTDDEVFMTCLTNIGAGSDTTSISLSAILYYLVTHQDAMVKLRTEIKKVLSEHSSDRMSFQTTQQMPFLQACIKEALRLHPATGLPLSRVVPQGGAEISGHFFPAGTEVGVNIWVAHRNKEVFGLDADRFRPERWLEADQHQLSRMEGYYLPFGHGSRTCIGKNISLLEINKLIPRLVMNFDLELLDQRTGLQCQNVWFVKQINLKCRVTARSESRV